MKQIFKMFCDANNSVLFTSFQACSRIKRLAVVILKKHKTVNSNKKELLLKKEHSFLAIFHLSLPPPKWWQFALRILTDTDIFLALHTSNNLEAFFTSDHNVIKLWFLDVQWSNCPHETRPSFNCQLSQALAPRYYFVRLVVNANPPHI